MSNILSVRHRPALQNSCHALADTVNDCANIIYELENETPLSPEEAMQAVEFLMTAGFRGKQPDDPERYLLHFVEEMTSYPAAIARKAVKEIAQHEDFFPSRAKFHATLEAAEGERRALLYGTRKRLRALVDETREREERDRRLAGHWRHKRCGELTPTERKKAIQSNDVAMRNAGYR